MTDGVFSKQASTIFDRALYHWRVREARRCLTGLTGKKRICDLGCGYEGEFLHSLGSRMEYGVGIDQEVQSLSESKTITLLKSDLNQPLPLENNSFDAVVSLAVIEHLTSVENHVREARRILTEGGQFILTTPRPVTKPVWNFLVRTHLIGVNEVEDHEHYYDKKDLIDILRNAGFTEIRYHWFEFGFNQIIIGKK